jgi:hypothetical protein
MFDRKSPQLIAIALQYMRSGKVQTVRGLEEIESYWAVRVRYDTSTVPR